MLLDGVFPSHTTQFYDTKHNCSCRQEKKKSFTKQVAMIKYYSSIISQKVSGAAIYLAGDARLTQETGIENIGVIPRS